MVKKMKVDHDGPINALSDFCNFVFAHKQWPKTCKELDPITQATDIQFKNLKNKPPLI